MTDERKNLPSASGIERLTLCPGSWQLERKCPEPPQSEDAAFGERVHAALAGELKLTELTGEELDTFDKCNSISAELVKEIMLANCWEGAPIADYCETRIWLNGPDGNPVISGKSDRTIVFEVDRERIGVVIDFKTGRNEVAIAAGNMQLRALAVLASKEYKLDRVYVAIVQPWVSPQSSVCEYQSDHLAFAYNELLKLLLQAHSGDAQRKPSEKACKYCRANNGTCPEARETVSNLALTKIHGTGEVLDPRTLGTLLERCGQAKAIIGSIEAEAKRQLEAGIDIPGYRLKPGAVREKVTDVQTVFGRVSAMGATPAEFTAICSVTKTELKALIKSKTEKKGKELDSELCAVLDGCTEEKQSAPSLERVKGVAA